MRTHVWTCDPGKASGIITGWYDDATAFTLDESTELFAETPNEAAVLVGEKLMEWIHWTFNNTERGDKFRVIVEGFITHSGRNRPGHIDGNWSIQPIGAVAFILNRWDGIHYTERQPGVPKSIPNDLLRSAGYWVTSKDDDARSAMKHTLAQLCDEGHLPTIRALDPR